MLINGDTFVFTDELDGGFSAYEVFQPIITNVGASLRGQVDFLARFRSELIHRGVTICFQNNTFN